MEVTLQQKRLSWLHGSIYILIDCPWLNLPVFEVCSIMKKIWGNLQKFKSLAQKLHLRDGFKKFLHHWPRATQTSRIVFDSRQLPLEAVSVECMIMHSFMIIHCNEWSIYVAGQFMLNLCRSVNVYIEVLHVTIISSPYIFMYHATVD